jgi:SAM-dependent methyltransferase
MDDDRRRWDERYEDRRPGEPAPPVALGDLHDHVPRAGRALDVACGLGEQTVWLAARGLHVDAVDVSPVAVARVRELAHRVGVADRVHVHVADLDRGLPTHLPGPYDVVVCQRFRDPRLYAPLVERTALGGLLVVTVLSAVGLDGEPGEFHAPAGELIAAFTRADLDVVRATEAAGEASIVARRTGGQMAR